MQHGELLTAQRDEGGGIVSPAPGQRGQPAAPRSSRRAPFSSSPLASQGRIYLLSEDGEMFVLLAGDRYDEVARTNLDEMSLASPAADADSLYVRPQTRLYRLQDR